MLCEDKVYLMHETAQYERSAEEYGCSAREYLRDDYLSMHLLQSFLSYTLSYLLTLGVFLLYFLEYILNAVNVSVVLRSVLRCVMIYAVGLLFFEFMTYLMFRRYYEESAMRREEHLRHLKRLKRCYDAKEGARELGKEESANA